MPRLPWHSKWRLRRESGKTRRMTTRLFSRHATTQRQNHRGFLLGYAVLRSARLFSGTRKRLSMSWPSLMSCAIETREHYNTTLAQIKNLPFLVRIPGKFKAIAGRLATISLPRNAPSLISGSLVSSITLVIPMLGTNGIMGWIWLLLDIALVWLGKKYTWTVFEGLKLESSRSILCSNSCAYSIYNSCS